MSTEECPDVPGTVLNGTQSSKVGVAGSKSIDAINVNLVWAADNANCGC